MTLNELIEELTALRDANPSIANDAVLIDNPEDAKRHFAYAHVIWVRRNDVDGRPILETD